MLDGFEDVYLPDSCLAALYRSSPRMNTSIVVTSSAMEHRNRNWRHPLWRFLAPEILRCHEQIEDLKDHWLVMGGPHIAFPFRDMFDFASIRLQKANKVPAIASTDQVLGVGDGVTTDFQLTKTYPRGSLTYPRDITLPVVSSVLVAMNALDPATADPTLPGGPYTWDVTRQGGVLTILPAPAVDVIVTSGYLFDVPARFEDDDSFDMIMKAWQLSGAADLAFLEIRPCEISGS